MEQLLLEQACEDTVSVWHNVGGHAMQSVDIIKEQLSNLGRNEGV